MNQWTSLASKEQLEKAAMSLTEHGMKTIIVENGEEAKKKVFELIPKDAEVMDMTSVTLHETGIADLIHDSGKYNSVKNILYKLNRETDQKQMQQLGAAPDVSIGSAHAVTEEGSILIASNTGSQLAAEVYGANHVIFVVGGQKIVKNTDEGMKRIYEHVLPLESERAKKVYGASGSFVSKLLIINKEIKPDRITVILVNESLGF